MPDLTDAQRMAAKAIELVIRKSWPGDDITTLSEDAARAAFAALPREDGQERVARDFLAAVAAPAGRLSLKNPAPTPAEVERDADLIVRACRTARDALYGSPFADAPAAPREDEATLVAAVEGVLEQHVEAPMPEAVAFNLQSSYHELAKAIVRALPVAPREDEGLRERVAELERELNETRSVLLKATAPKPDRMRRAPTSSPVPEDAYVVSLSDDPAALRRQNATLRARLREKEAECMRWARRWSERPAASPVASREGEGGR